MTEGEKILEISVEKRRFYLAEFDREALWLSEKRKGGRRLIAVKGTRYTFEACEPEEWEYRIEFGEENEEEEDGRGAWEETGWEFAADCGAWERLLDIPLRRSTFRKRYFRRKRGRGEPFAPDVLLPLDRFERVVRTGARRSIPLLLGSLAYEFIIWGTPLLEGRGVFSMVLTLAALVLATVIVYRFGIYIGQLDRLQRRMAAREKEHDE